MSVQGGSVPKAMASKSLPIFGAAIFSTLMLFTLLLSDALKPTEMLAAKREHMSLATTVPRQFGDWHPRRDGEIVLVASDVGKVLADTYSETLDRVYSIDNEESSNDVVMLSMAYGSQQKQGLRIHRQEVCYEAQGFRINNLKRVDMRVQGRSISATRFEATSGPRMETVVYWFTMGDNIVSGYLDRQATQLRYALSGYVPDGYLFRVSVIGPDAQHNTKVLERFIADFFADTPPELNARIIGRSQSAESS